MWSRVNADSLRFWVFVVGMPEPNFRACVQAAFSSGPSAPSQMLQAATCSRAHRLCYSWSSFLTRAHHITQLPRRTLVSDFLRASPRRNMSSTQASPDPPPAPTITPGCDLTQASCQGHCDSNTPLVTEQELAWLLPAVPRWKLGPDGKSLLRTFTARNFMAAMNFLQSVAVIAEREGHHPDLHLTNYRDVELVVSTHAAGGLTKFDFVLAAHLDTLPVDYSPKWLRENPEPEKKPS